MKVKEFLGLIDFENLLGGSEYVTLIIPVQENLSCIGDCVLGECNLSEKSKVIIDCSEGPEYGAGKYVNYGIYPVVNNSGFEYEEVDLKVSADNYKYIYNTDGEVWVVVSKMSLI